MPEVLAVKDLVTKFYTETETVHAVNGVSFHVDESETLGVVGESGCGKSVSMHSLLRLIPMPPGRIESGQAITLSIGPATTTRPPCSPANQARSRTQ